MRIIFREKGLWLLSFVIISFQVQAQGTTVSAPKNDSEILQLMKITYNQHILPEGANQKTLEHLLEAGAVVVFYDHPPVVSWMSAGGIMVNAPVDEVFSVVTDFEHYKDYVPFTAGAEVESISGNLVRVNFHLRVAMAFLHYGVDYGVYHYHRPPYRTDWAHAWGEFNINVGFWELIPTLDGKRTMAFYSVYSEPRSELLKAIYERDPNLEIMTNLSTSIMVTRAVKFEAEKRFKAKGGPVPASPKPSSVFEILAEDPATMGKFLERGKLLVLEDGPTVYVTAGTIVNALQEQCWCVITDFLHYPEFAPGTKEVEFLGMGEKGPKYHWEAVTDMLFLTYGYSYNPEFILNPKDSLQWTPGVQDNARVNGFWRLINMGAKSLLFYGTTADIRAMGRIPRYALSKEPTLEHAILGSQALINISAIKKEIEKRAKKGAKAK